MSATKKNIIDAITNLLSKMKVTDESRLDANVLSYLIDNARAELIRADYAETGLVDMTWLTNLGTLTCYEVNAADDITVSCSCNVSKTTIPQLVSITSKNGNQDLGLYSLSSVCGKYTITPKPMFRWFNTPAEHTNSLFMYYFRVNTDLYISKVVEKIKGVAILLNPEDGYLINSIPVASGSLVSGTVYIVKYGGITYNNVYYAPNATFTANSTNSFTTTNGKVYNYSQVQSYRFTDPYPASGDMIRRIQIEVMTKEFGIERGAIPDNRNDSIDDAQKVQ